LGLVTVGSSATEGMAILRNDARQSQVPTQRSVETENSAFQPEGSPCFVKFLFNKKAMGNESK
jgi:hypothetical protein